MNQVTLRIPAQLMQDLQNHLFPGDQDEHGAVLGVGISETKRGTRLLAKKLILARDGIDYVAGERGYRMLTPDFVRDSVLECENDGLGYLAVHCHGGEDSVGFSSDDLRSHDRGYAALQDILADLPVGGLVFASNAVAGDIWLASGRRVELSSARVIGQPIQNLYPRPQPGPVSDPDFDRQTRIFGDRGQAILKGQKVGVIGAGGVGSLLVEYLSRLGVGEIVLIDPDHIEATNLSRVVGSKRRDACTWLTSNRSPVWIQRIGERLAKPKVNIAQRVARQANPKIQFTVVKEDVTRDKAAKQLIDCDYLFLAADSMQARVVFNALVHQYLIPGVQLGARVVAIDGDIEKVFSVIRPVLPGFGCLLCNGLINASQLQDEAISEGERKRQRYVDDENVHAPSVISLNAVAAAHGIDQYLFATTGLFQGNSDLRWSYYYPIETSASDRVEQNIPVSDPACIDCGMAGYSRLAMGDAKRLPTRP